MNRTTKTPNFYQTSWKDIYLLNYFIKYYAEAGKDEL